jgi:Protein of unknown function (DUF2867)
METVRPASLPHELRGRTTLPQIDYTDAFVAETKRSGFTAEQWARQMLDAASPYWRRTLPLGWRILGLDHGPADAAGHILGWPIVGRTDDWILLGAHGRRGLSAQLLFAWQADGMLFATFVHQHNRAASLEWSAIAPMHRRIVTQLLKDACARPC